MLQDNPERTKPLLLLVDDNPRNLQLLGTLLRIHLDCDQAIAMNGKEAIAQAEAVMPDLILLDIMMPEMDGYEACTKLKANPATAEIPVIFLTAVVQPEEIVRGFNAGAVDYISKPFQAAELMARVKTQLKIQENYHTIQRQNDERKQLLHVLCHDLANPFAAIISTMEMITDGESFLKLKKALLDTAENGLNLIDLVRRIRSLEEKGVLNPERPVALNDMLTKAQLLLRTRFSAKNITLIADIQNDTTVMVEPICFINSVLNNLLSNAIKFSFPNSEIFLKATMVDGHTTIIIQDNGIGMPEIILENLFNIRKMTSRPGTAGETGTGFGMPLVKRFIEASHGSIKIVSRDKAQFPDNHGTEVIISLPAT